VKEFSGVFVDPLILLTLDFRLMEEADTEILRKWKNENRLSFFHQGHISASQQKAWYAAESDDFEKAMFVWTSGEKICGSIGLHRAANIIEVYNVMSWCESMRGTGRFRVAVESLLDAVHNYLPSFSIQASVLSGNTAASWYRKLGFVDSERMTHSSGKEFINMKFKYAALPTQRRNGKA